MWRNMVSMFVGNLCGAIWKTRAIAHSLVQRATTQGLWNNPDNISDGSFGEVTGEGSQIINRQGQVSFRVEF